MHCMVDSYFTEYVIKRQTEKHGKWKNSCLFCENLHFVKFSELIQHLTREHFFEFIKIEVENKVSKKTSDTEVEFKCPLCCRKFQNSPDSEQRDLTGLVLHCGNDHGFTFYHLVMNDIKTGCFGNNKES